VGKINTFNFKILKEIHARLEGIALGKIIPFQANGLKPVVQTLENVPQKEEK
jgi:hypothetical protein